MAIEIKSGELLSAEQLLHHMKIYAGPGAGKTHFLVENVKNIVRSNTKITQSATRKVLCITYTNAAVNEIKRRIEDYGDSVVVFTIHGFILEYIIKPYQTELKKYMLKDFGINIKTKGLISSQIEGLGVLHGHDKEKIFEYITKETHTDCELSYGKKSMGDIQIDIEEYCNSGRVVIKRSNKIDESHAIAIKKYTWAKAKRLAHDEILYFGYRLATSNSTISYALRVQFPYIFVDEFQDTNPLQAMLIKHIGLKSSIIGVIGDLAQSIYSFQGAKPSKFREFNVNEATDTWEYQILGNRRSTDNIISLCNYIRKSDTLVQKGIREYEDDIIKSQKELKKVCFLVGDNDDICKEINKIVGEGGVVLTRTWAAAFNYMDGVSSEQKTILKRIYNSYYMSPIDIRSEIAEHKNVTWVRAFKFIFSLWDAYRIKSFIDVMDALTLYVDVDTLKTTKALTVSVVNQLNKLLQELFSNQNRKEPTIKVIERFNDLLRQKEYKELSDVLLNTRKDITDHFVISYFSELDRDDLIANVSKLEWDTSYILFENVFANNSKYMTVHQAKGLEWEKVVVSIEPTKKEGTTFPEMFLNPQITQETSHDEFTRLFYVACSRAKDELFIHLKNSPSDVEAFKGKLEEYAKEKGLLRFFEFWP